MTQSSVIVASLAFCIRTQLVVDHKIRQVSVRSALVFKHNTVPYSRATHPITPITENAMDSQQHHHEQPQSSFSQSFFLMNLPSIQVAVVQDNAPPPPPSMTKTMRRYLLDTFPDLANIAEETRWKSQPSPMITKAKSLRNILPVVPQRQASFTKAKSFRNFLPVAPQRQDSITLSSHSIASTISTVSTTPAPPSINRRQFLVRQASNVSLLIRQNSLRRMGGGAGMPRMPQRQDSVSFLY